MKINARCWLLFGSFYAFVCVVSSFVTYYLDVLEHTNKTIGILISVCCAVGAVLQFPAGRIADKYPEFYWKNQLLVFGILAMLVCLSRIMFHVKGWGLISSGILLILMYLMMPMVNQAVFYYSNNGFPVNFGVTRGIGAVSFALASYVVGKATGLVGHVSVRVSSAIFLAVMLITVLILPKVKETAAASSSEPKQTQPQNQMSTGFVRKYTMFLIVTVGITLVLTFHNFLNTYFLRIVERIGGDSSHMGTALAIAAFSEIPILFLYSKIAGIKKVTTKMLIIVGCSVFVLRGVLYLLIGNTTMLYASQLLQGISFGILVAAKATYSNEVMDENDKTTGQSIMSMTDTVAAVIGSLAGGVIIDHQGLAPALVCSTILAAAGTVMIILTSLKKQAQI